VRKRVRRREEKKRKSGSKGKHVGASRREGERV